MTLAIEAQASWVRNFNPFLPTGNSRAATRGAIYESLFLFDSIQGQERPWLATSSTWSDDNRRLSVTTREGVLWSDGTPFTAHDVAFTFRLLKSRPALDTMQVWAFLSDVVAVDDGHVDFVFSREWVPGRDQLVVVPIVPAHVWSKVEDPLLFSNPSPVATGPFTEVRRFEGQVFELGRNPRYWQEGLPKVDGLRFPAYLGNDQANLALLHDEIDWASNFVPAIERIYVKPDPEHHKYWFPPIGPTIFLYTNTARPPLDDVVVRKAISMALDRKLLVRIAVYDYTTPANPTGMAEPLARYRDPEAVAVGAKWQTFDVEGANAMLDAAGYARDEDGVRHRKDGEPLTFTLEVVAGWSDWVRGAQIMKRQIKAIGIDVNVRTYDFGAWFDRLQRGEFELSIGWSAESPSPVAIYRGLLATTTVKPLGVASPVNWHRFGLPESTALFDAFDHTTDPEEQRALAAKLQMQFVEHAPAIPLWAGPVWGAFNTKRFVGFPSKDDPYATPTLNNNGEYVFALLRIVPRATQVKVKQ
jgi:peptide/nickel transport system substrate-binding protein